MTLMSATAQLTEKLEFNNWKIDFKKIRTAFRIYTIAIKLSIFLYDPYFRSNEKYFEFWVLFDTYTCILATKFG